MLSEKVHDQTNRQAELALMASIWQSIKDQLESERQRVYAEIKTYPHPIPACDLQFNALLEERVRIAQELDRLEALSRESLTQKDPVKLIDEFIIWSNYMKGEVGQRIRSAFLKVSDGSAADARER